MAELLDPEHWGRGRPSGVEDADGRAPGPRRTGARSTLSVEPSETDWEPFEEPSAQAHANTPRRTPQPDAPHGGSRTPLILGGILAVLVLIAGGVWAAASGLLPLGDGRGGGEPGTPAASAPATDAPAPTATPSAPAGAGATPLPVSCDDIFGSAMRGTVEAAGLVLNPSWYETAGEVRLPSEDGQLSEMLGSVPRLDCAWLQPEGGSGVGIFTSVSQVTSDQAAAANARMVELGYGAMEQQGGVRYVTETSGDGSTLGESHFIKDGLWFGTLWINYGPSGYTADMVTQVLG